MFASIFLDLTAGCNSSKDHAEGVAFLKAVKSLYQLLGVSYVAINISNKSGDGSNYLHCCYTDREIRRRTSATQINLERLDVMGLTRQTATDWQEAERLDIELRMRAKPDQPIRSGLRGISQALPPCDGESALFGITTDAEEAEWRDIKHNALLDLRILASYFHSHVLRLSGHDASEEMIVSAKELDCLKWTAAGKTAWEASVILGISERTVRFHLNAAREKLRCATTTQAVAKAVSHKLISI